MAALSSALSISTAASLQAQQNGANAAASQKVGTSSQTKGKFLPQSSLMGSPLRRKIQSLGAQVRQLPSGKVSCSLATTTPVDYVKLNEELEQQSPFQILDKALEMFGDDIAIAFSGAEDVALIEYAKLTGRKFRVFSLDTGRLNPETYQFFEKVEKHYGIHIEYTFPDSAAVEKLVREKGMFSFYVDGHNECCGIRKVQPLRKALKGLKAWVTGQRKDQSPTRSLVPTVQVDPAFEGLDGGKGSLIKFNPLANVSSLDVWDFIRVQNVPYNELHTKGFISIGCEPCTKTVLPNQHEREGRWWWEEATAKECGLHKGNVESAEPKKENGNASTNGNAIVVDDLFKDSAVVSLSRADMEQLASSDALSRQESSLVVLYAPWCPYCKAMEESYEQVANELKNSGIRVAKFNADGENKQFAKETFDMPSYPTILLFPKNSKSFIRRLSERRDVNSLLTWVKALA